MDNQDRETLFGVFETVLEQFAFLFCELVSKDELETGQTEFIHSFLSFTGPHSGEMALAVPLEIGIELAGNILSIDEDDENAAVYGQDSLRELLNVLAGHILTTHFGEEEVFDIGSPSAAFLNERDLKDLLDDPDSISFLIDEKPGLLRFHVTD